MINFYFFLHNELQVYVDLRALRNNRVALVERGAPNSLCLVESGKLLPGVKVIIANPDTKGQCGDSHLGEIWVNIDYNSRILERVFYLIKYVCSGSITAQFQWLFYNLWRRN
jgi:hypothetical protein